MLNNVRLSKLEIKKRLLEKLNTISGNQAEQESQIMISYSAKKENYLDVNNDEIEKELINKILNERNTYFFFLISLFRHLYLASQVKSALKNDLVEILARETYLFDQ